MGAEGRQQSAPNFVRDSHSCLPKVDHTTPPRLLSGRTLQRESQKKEDMSEPTIPLVLTPEAEEDWEGFVHSPILLNKLGDGWVLHGSTFRKGYPVYAFTYGKSRIFREGKKWYMSLENDNFVKSLETKHIPGGDPNLPPTGVGWKWCDSQSMCLEGVAFRIAPSFELRLAREASECLTFSLVIVVVS